MVTQYTHQQRARFRTLSKITQKLTYCEKRLIMGDGGAPPALRDGDEEPCVISNPFDLVKDSKTDVSSIRPSSE